MTEGNHIVYREQVNMNYKFQGWEETLTGTGHVEFLLRTESSEPIEMRSEGRASLARMKLLMTFLFDDRLLGPVLTEEIGRIFPDWHWNREIGTEAVAAESHTDTHQLSGDEIVSQLQLLIDSEQSLVETDQRRLALAAHWYWMAMSDASTVNRFLQLWIVFEALEMAAESRANLRAVRHRLANLCGNTADEWQQLIGRLYGCRGDLVHGKVRSISEPDVARLEMIAGALLLGRLLVSLPQSLVAELMALLR